MSGSVTLRMVADAMHAARGGGAPKAEAAARAWLAECPWIESRYASQEAWRLAQGAAQPFRSSAASLSGREDRR